MDVLTISLYVICCVVQDQRVNRLLDPSPDFQLAEHICIKIHAPYICHSISNDHVQPELPIFISTKLSLLFAVDKCMHRMHFVAYRALLIIWNSVLWSDALLHQST